MPEHNAGTETVEAVQQRTAPQIAADIIVRITPPLAVIDAPTMARSQTINLKAQWHAAEDVTGLLKKPCFCLRLGLGLGAVERLRFLEARRGDLIGAINRFAGILRFKFASEKCDR